MLGLRPPQSCSSCVWRRDDVLGCASLFACVFCFPRSASASLSFPLLARLPSRRKRELIQRRRSEVQNPPPVSERKEIFFLAHFVLGYPTPTFSLRMRTSEGESERGSRPNATTTTTTTAMLSSRRSPIRRARSGDGPRSLGGVAGERGAGALLPPRRVRTSARDDSVIGACADRLRKPLAGTRGRLPSHQVASAALRVKDALDRTLSALGAEDHHRDRHEELSREFPRTRREAMVGASCCTSAVSDSIEVSGSASSSLPWHQAKGSRRLCNHLLLLALVPTERPLRAGTCDSAPLAESLSLTRARLRSLPSLPPLLPSKDAAADPSGGSATYVDARNGFSLSPPSQWSVGSKSGAAILFKDPEYKFNSLGVTVTPVKIGSLAEFGSVETAADRLISFEKNKVSKRAKARYRDRDGGTHETDGRRLAPPLFPSTNAHSRCPMPTGDSGEHKGGHCESLVHSHGGRHGFLRL